MIQILQACPSLVQLNLHRQRMSTSFLAQFAYHRAPENSTTQQLVPMLRTMNIGYSEQNSTSLTLPMLFSRDHIK